MTKIKATVNGKVMELNVQSMYYNGRENVWECVNEDGVFIAVEQHMIVSAELKVRTRFEYIGDLTGEHRTVRVTITGLDKNHVEYAYELLCEVAEKESYMPTACQDVEPYKKGYAISEYFQVEDRKDSVNYKNIVYTNFKAKIAG